MADNKSIITLSSPWCFFADESKISKEELEELQKRFVDSSNDCYSWKIDRYNGITSYGESNYYGNIASFDEDDNKENVTVYTIEQLRDIINPPEVKQPVNLEDGVVYYATDPRDEHEWILVKNVSYIHLNKSRYETLYTNFDKDMNYVYTKATPKQIAHYEACVKAGKYVEPESVTQFEVGKWYKTTDSDRGFAKFLRLEDGIFRYSERIWSSREYAKSESTAQWELSNVEEVDLSEIQNLLPDGHPDKWVKTAPNYWSVGTYVVALLDKAISIHSWFKGDIAKIHTTGHITLLTDNSSWACNNTDEKAGKVKWFATLVEAEEFAKTLKEPVYLDDKGRPLKEFKVGSWYTNPKMTPKKLLNGNPACFFRVSSCIRKGSSRDYYYHQLEFSEVADKDWNKEVVKINQSNTDHDQEMVEVFPVVKSERYLETMKFFEQLREPERSQAIANYNEEYDEQVPGELYTALVCGFSWNSSTEGNNYWADISNSIENGNYFKEELLVFPKEGSCKTNDSRLEEYFRINGKLRTKESIGQTKDYMCWNSSSWWVANTTSKQEYQFSQLEPFLLDIKPKDYKESVHCTTQEEWDFVLSKFNPANISSKNFWDEKDQSTITILDEDTSCIGSYANVDYDKSEGTTILTFKQWCEKYGHSYEVVPKYVECVSSKTHHYKEGKIYTWPDTITEECKPNKPDILKGGVWEFKPSTKEAYDKQQEKFKMQELLSEAKRRYPVGTYVLSAYRGTKCKVASHEKLFVDFAGRVDNNGYGFLYCEGKWAEIVKEEPKPTEIKPAKGMHVRCLKENSWRDGKTKVGQVFVIEDVDYSGDMLVNNNYLAKERLRRGEFELLPDYKEEPWVAQVGDWVYVLDRGTAYKLKEGEIRKCVQVATSDEEIALSEKQPGYWLKTGEYRKATQEEIDSVTKPEKKDSIFEQLREPMFDIDMVLRKLHSAIEKHKPQQDELVIYKPKQTRLVEPGAVSASVSTTNLIIKSNSKYL